LLEALRLGQGVILYAPHVGNFFYLYDQYTRNQKAEATAFLNGFHEEIIKEVPAQWFYWFNCDERWGNKT